MKNAIYKNKVLGIGFAVIAFFGTQNVAHGAVSYSRTPSGDGVSSQSVTLTISNFNYLTDLPGYNPDVDQTCSFYLADLYSDLNDYSMSGFSVSDSSHSQTITYENVIRGDVTSLGIQCGTELDYKIGHSLTLEGDDFYTIISLVPPTPPATTYGGMFPSGSETSLTANISNFMSSGIMNFILVFIACIISFLLFGRLIEIARLKKETKEIEEQQDAENDEEKEMTKKEKFR